MLYIDSNIPKSIVCSALVCKFLRTASVSLLYQDFLENDMELHNTMRAHGVKSHICSNVLSKIIPRHKEMFAKFENNCDETLFELHI